MSNIGSAETPISDHVARFWTHLQTDTVRIVLDLKRTVGTDAPDGPVVYWDGSTFSDDVAKALVADRNLRDVMLKDALCAVETLYGDDGLRKVADHMRRANKVREDNAEIDALEHAFADALQR